MLSFSFISRIVLVFELILLTTFRVSAQIKTDATLGIESSVVTNNQVVKGTPSSVVSGGAVRGNNLFHSFSDFNVNLGQGVYFTAPIGVSNILTRVTGNNSSTISGVLGVLGNANLFLLNPHGLIFGPNARLDLSGSFLGSTSDSVLLSNGNTFSARQPQSVPLLTVSIPIGLNFSENSGSIQVQGPGHSFVQPGSPIAPIQSLNPIPTGLLVSPGATLALVGNNITFEGGVLTAPGGSIELGSVKSGVVDIVFPSQNKFSLSYNNIQKFQDILLARQSLLNASGLDTGTIKLTGRQIEFTDASVGLIQNSGSNPLSIGSIDINAQESLTLTGLTANTQAYPGITTGITIVSRGLLTQSLLNAPGADININTKNLVIQDTGLIFLEAYSTGNSGNLNINASNSVLVTGPSLANPFLPVGSFISVSTAGSGKAGNVLINTKQLSILGGGELLISTFGSGQGGDLIVNSDTVNLDGFIPVSYLPSLLASLTAASNKAGDLVINAKQVTLSNGGRIDSSTLSSGAAGSVTINASQFIDVSGIVPGSPNPTLITSSGSLLSPFLQTALLLPSQVTGKSGNVILSTSRLNVTNGAQVTVKNDGVGDAGFLGVNADSIYINNNGTVNASTNGGQGGNINIADRRLQLQNGGSITANAQGGSGNGGNVTINTDTLLAIRNSKVTARADQGKGGRITVKTQGYFHSLDSTLNTSSDAGPQFDGITQFITPFIDFTRSTNKPEAIPQSPQVESVCQGDASTKVSQLISTGSGGLPANPNNLAPNVGWQDNSLLPSTSQQMPNQIQVPVLREVKGWVKHNGIVTLLPTLDRADQTSNSSICPSTK